MPKLRFPEFTDEYTKVTIGDVYSERSERCTEEIELLSVTINDGVKRRSEIEGKDNSSDDKSNYKIVHIGDMVYNSMRMWQGASGISQYYGIVSPAYTVLQPQISISNNYFAALFKTKKLIDTFQKNSQGLTSDTWNLKYPQIAPIKICIPTLIEQNKIAKMLDILSKRIEKQKELISFFNSYKRGFFQRLLSRYQKSEYLIKDIVIEYNEKATIDGQYPILSSTMNGIKLQSSYFNKQAASENTLGYKIVPFGYFTYRSMSDTGVFHFNYQDIIDYGIISPAYPVFRLSESNNSRFVEYVLNESDFMKSQLLVAKEGGTRYALSFSKFQELKIELPNKSIQDQIANLIQLFEHKIELEENVLQRLNNLKTTLLQQLFI